MDVSKLLIDLMFYAGFCFSIKIHRFAENFAEWTQWETWWDCSKTCGGGETVRYRDCEENGKWMPGCPGKDTNKKECNTQSCSGESGE